MRLSALVILLGLPLRQLPAQIPDEKVNVVVGGMPRTYLLHTPRMHAQGRIPLVILLHGRLGTGSGMARLTGFDSVSESHGLLVAYPDGYRRSWADGRGGTPADKAGVNDVAFIGAIIDDVARHYPLDRGRVYAAGMSNGAFMAERLACEMSGRLAAVGVIAATLGDSLAAQCHPALPISIMFVNGTDDPLVPFLGGEMSGGRGSGLSVAATVARWVELNGCTAQPVLTTLSATPPDGTQALESLYDVCQRGAEVVAYRIEQGGHTWPGGPQYLPESIVGKTSRTFAASSVLWDFFARHTR
ncbi:MAG TPA: PHB depolymerase family esterase [Gemmatimonadales bacterium]|nr:PHB depolymerase family esterase [Gemmatimonadales bacterium]